MDDVYTEKTEDVKVKGGIIHDDKRAGNSHTVARVTELGISLKAMSKRLVLAENTCLSSALGKEEQITYLHNSVRGDSMGHYLL